MKQILLFFIAILFTSSTAFAQGDECSNATPLTLENGTSCTAGGSYTWTGATASTGHPAPGCASYSTGDVWFSFTIPAGSNQDIFITTSSSLDGGGALYSGDCASTSLISCSDDDAGGLDPEISVADLAPGTYYFRFWDYDDGTSGDVDICVAGVAPPPPPAAPAANCADANPLCSDALGQEYAANTTGTAEIGNNYGCLTTQPRPSWFYFQAASAGDLEIQINNTVDLDFAMWGPYSDLSTALAACGTLPAPVDCSYSASASPEVANYTGASTGDVFILLITAYSSSPTTFTVTEGAGMTATTDCNVLDPCSASITETVPPSNFVYCNQMTGSTTIGMDANSGSGYQYTFDAGPNATANAGVTFAEICGNYDPTANTTAGDPRTNPNYTGFLVNDAFDYGAATANGQDPFLGCDYITLVPITHTDVDAITGDIIFDENCFAIGTAFIADFYSEITASFDCAANKIVVAGGSPDDIGNPVAGEYTIAGDLNGVTTGGEFVTGAIANATYNLTITDPHGCDQTVALVVNCVSACGTSDSGICYTSGTLTTIAYNLCPDNPTDYLTVNITQGVVENTYDELIVYSGVSGTGTGGTEIYNGYGGPVNASYAVIEGFIFTSANAGECLSLYIDGDVSTACDDDTNIQPVSYTTSCSATAPEPNGCAGSMDVIPICTDTPVSFAAGVNGEAVRSSNPNINMGCLGYSPNPAWYYLEVATGGTLSFDISNSMSNDVDWAVWGPFNDLADINSSCAAGSNAFAAAPVDCDYSTLGAGIINLGVVNTGELYAILVTNFANSPTDVSFATTIASTASTDCGALCGASAVVLAPSGTSTANAQCEDGPWTYYYDPAAPADMLFAIEWAPDGTLSTANGNAKSGASVDIVLGSMHSQTAGPEASYAMARYWDVTAAAFDEPVNVKFFYDPAEKTGVETAAQNYGGTYEGFKWFKTTSGTYDPNTHNTPTGVTGVIELTAAGGGTENGVTYVQFDGITSFSGGTGAAGAGTQGVILPIELVSFTGKERGAVNLLEWSTASEKDTEWMVVERSANGKDNWTTVGEVAAYGNTNKTQYYELEDTRPLNLSYYRLKSIDTDGSFQLSNVISIRRAMSGFEIASISPNPTKDVLNVGVVAGTDAPTTLVLRDIAGRELQRYQFETTAGDNNFSINLNDVSNGIYLLTIENNTHRLIEKIVKN